MKQKLIDLAGKVTGRSCSGKTYADSYGSWDKVLVQGIIKITLTKEYAKVNQGARERSKGKYLSNVEKA